MKRKGQFVSTLAVFTLIFIAAGNIYSGLLIKSSFEKTISYNSGSLTTISGAKTKEEFYIPRMEKELNYSSNIIALQLGRNGGDASEGEQISWRDGIPDDMEQRLIDEYSRQVAQEASDQGEVANCQSPDISGVEISDETDLKLVFSRPSVKCTSQSSTVEVFLHESIEVNNSRNRYVPISRYAVGLAKAAEDNMPEEVDREESRHTAEGECINRDEKTLNEINAEEESVENEAEEAAVQELSDALPPVAEDARAAVNDEDQVRETSVDTDTVAEADASLVNSDKTGWFECDDQDLSKYNATVEASLTGIRAEFRITDDRHSIVNRHGDTEALEFEFAYVSGYP